MADPNFANVVLLLHCDGSNGSTTFTDVIGHTVTPVGTAQIATAQSKFGASSAHCIGNDGFFNYLSLASSADWAFGTGDFTVEFWVKLSAISQTADIVQFGPTWIINISSATLALRFHDGTAFRISGGTVQVNGSFQHVALVRSGGNVSLYLDGASVGASFNAPTNITAAGLTLGNLFSGLNDLFLDEIRITKGVARYTANFSPPTEAFPDSASEDHGVALGRSEAPGVADFVLDASFGVAVAAGTSSAEGAWDALASASGVSMGRARTEAVAFTAPTGAARLDGILTYTLTLTGAPNGLPDFKLPMESFQARLRSGEASSLSTVIPGATGYYAAIVAREKGDLIVTAAVLYPNGTRDSVELARVHLETIRLDTGSSSVSISLSGTRQTTNTNPSTVALAGISYTLIDNGARRYRARMDPWLRAGDTVLADGLSLIATELTYSVSVRATTAEVAVLYPSDGTATAKGSALALGAWSSLNDLVGAAPARARATGDGSALADSAGTILAPAQAIGVGDTI